VIPRAAGVMRIAKKTNNIRNIIWQYNNDKEANQSLQTNVIGLVYISRVYPNLCTTKSDK